jgi:hypothetical protein
MKALNISETSGNIHPTQRHIRDELNLRVSGYQTVVLLGFCTMLLNGLARTFRETPSVVLQPDSVFDRFGYSLPLVLRLCPAISAAVMPCHWCCGYALPLVLRLCPAIGAEVMPCH